MNFYIASCVFTSKYPELSFRIQNYIRTRFGDQAEVAGDSKGAMNIVRSRRATRNSRRSIM